MNVVHAALLDAISRSPSAHNTQPWHVQFYNNSLQLFLNKNRMISAIDETHTEAIHSIGAVLENIVITLNYCNMTAHYQIADELAFGEPLVTLQWNENTNGQHIASPLYQQIPLRRTSRDSYFNESIDPDILNSLREQCDSNCQLHILTDSKKLQHLRQLVTQATLSQFEDIAITQELYQWLRFSRKDKSWFRDGLNAECMSWNRVTTFLSKIVLKPSILKVLVKTKLHKLLLSNNNDHSPYAPAICLLVLDTDTLANRIEAGRSLQRIWLKASELGYVTHPVSAAVDMPLTRDKTKELYQIDKYLLHVNLFRLGKTKKVVRSHRLPMDSIIRK